MMNKSQIDNEKFRTSLLSYTFAQEDTDEKLEELQKFLLETEIGSIELNELKKRINQIKSEEKKLIHDQNRLAQLFTQSKQVRSYQFGSSFCPNCHMFKNYEKECPYCTYLEMTL